MKKVLFVSVLLLLCNCLCAQNGVLRGRVVDALTREPLVGAHVRIKDANKILAAGQDGDFSVILPLNVELILQTTFVGYTSSEIKVNMSGDTYVTVEMTPDNELSDVYVYGARRDFGVRSTQMSAVLVPRGRIEAVPALFGEVDVMKVLQKLPGVQSSGDGTSGIFVRGGNFDQNLITLDGSTLYNAEHLKGFVSAINGDMVHNVLLYKGAFPARYGARLSSVVDIGIKEGDFNEWKGSVGIGMLSSKLQLEGPLWKGRTSFNIGARASYFDAIVMPMLEKVYDKPESLQPYVNMDYYDINAKVVHKFSDNHKLSAVFYLGKDVNDSAPTESHLMLSGNGEQYDYKRSNSTENSWYNMVSSLFYTYKSDKDYSVNTNLSFSRYDYKLKIASAIDEERRKFNVDGEDALYEVYNEKSYLSYNSDVNDLALSTDFLLTKNRHDVRWGAKASIQKFGPMVDVFKDSYRKKSINGGGWYESTIYIDTLLGNNYNMQTLALYAEDDFDLTDKLKMNLGLRYSLFSVTNKVYHSVEPRISLRYLLNEKMSLKGAYSRMAQGVHLLTSTNLVMPSDIWVPVTENIPLMTSDQMAFGYNFNICSGVDFSVEGYYKLMDNVLEYAEGASYTRLNGDWQQQVALGKGRAYGVEFLLEKNGGKFEGWIGYTWAKSLRKFDSYGNVINGGKEFYAGNDRRHNLNIVFTHRFNKHWKLSGSWTFQTGRRGTLTTTTIYGGEPYEFDAFGHPASDDSYAKGDYSSHSPEKLIHLYKFLKYYTSQQRNGFVLPNIHRLDLGLAFTAYMQIGELDISLDICNVYNRMNISNVYVGYDDNNIVLKGICMLPFMPSVNVNFKF